MKYIFYIESNKAGELAYAIAVDDYEKCEFVESGFVESGFGEYKFEEGLEIIKKNGNIVTSYSVESREQVRDLVKLLLKKGLPKEQISSFLTLA